jgi:hypothetical protein
VLVALLGLAGCVSGAAPGDPELTLDNGVVKVGVSRAYGGAITWLSRSGEDRNLVNNHDQGRQIQQSYYAGAPLDRTAEGQHTGWTPWPWNPVQAGDAYHNPSEILAAESDGTRIYTKVRPLLWDMKNEPAEAHFETWITLEDNRVRVRGKLTCFRTDDRWPVAPRDQELPALYTIGALHTLKTYDGDAPFTRAPLRTVPSVWAEHVASGAFPWTRWGAGEKWAALVDDSGWGVGVYNAHAEAFLGGFAGTRPRGETADFETGYLSPLRTLAFDKDTVFDYEYELILGTVEEIRAHAYAREGHAPAP